MSVGIFTNLRQGIDDSARLEDHDPEQCEDDMTQYFIELYWPSPGRHAGDLHLWFHEDKLFQDDDVQDGDKVLIYEVGQNPDTGYRGSKSLFASCTVTAERCPVPEMRRTGGGKQWTILRKLNKDFVIAPEKGVPLSTLRRLLGFQGHAWFRRGTPLSRERFALLENELMKVANQP